MTRWESFKLMSNKELARVIFRAMNGNIYNKKYLAVDDEIYHSVKELIAVNVSWLSSTKNHRKKITNREYVLESEWNFIKLFKRIYTCDKGMCFISPSRKEFSWCLLEGSWGEEIQERAWYDDAMKWLHENIG